MSDEYFDVDHCQVFDFKPIGSTLPLWILIAVPLFMMELFVIFVFAVRRSEDTKKSYVYPSYTAVLMIFNVLRIVLTLFSEGILLRAKHAFFAIYTILWMFPVACVFAFLLSNSVGKNAIIRVFIIGGLVSVTEGLLTTLCIWLNTAVLFTAYRFLLILFLAYIISSRWSSRILPKSIKPRPSAFVMAYFYITTSILGILIPGLTYLISKKSFWCSYFGTTGSCMLFTMPILYYAFVIDSHYWRTLGNRISVEVHGQRNAYAPLLKPNTIKELHVVDFSRIILQKRVGSGATATVFRACLDNQKTVALKRFICDELDVDSAAKFIEEASKMSHLRHPNIVRFVGTSICPPFMCILSEYCENGSLRDVLKKTDMFIPPKQIIQMSLDCAKALHFIHSQFIIHRDIKSLNFLVDNNWIVKLTDFGESTKFQSVMTKGVGTVYWAAPEVIKELPYNEKADVYSLGIVFWEILSREYPFDHYSAPQVVLAVTERNERPVLPKDTVRPEFRDLIEKCWHQDPTKRPTSGEVVQYLEQINSLI